MATELSSPAKKLFNRAKSPCVGNQFFGVAVTNVMAITKWCFEQSVTTQTLLSWANDAVYHSLDLASSNCDVTVRFFEFIESKQMSPCEARSRPPP